MRELDFGKELIRKKIPLISNSPGVYRMLDKKNQVRSEEHTSELQSRRNLVCRLLLEKKK